MYNPFRQALEARYLALLSYSAILEGSKSVETLSETIAENALLFDQSLRSVKAKVFSILLLSLGMGLFSHYPAQATWEILLVIGGYALACAVMCWDLWVELKFLHKAYLHSREIQDLLWSDCTFVRDLCMTKQVANHELAEALLPQISTETLVTLITSLEEVYAHINREVPPRADVLEGFFSSEKENKKRLD